MSTITGRVVDSRGGAANEAQVRAMANGLRGDFFDFQTPLNGLPDLGDRRADGTRLLSAVNIRNPNEIFGNDPFGVGFGPDYAARLTGYLQITKPGLYQFFLGADEGARLVLDGKTLIDMPTGNVKFQEKSALMYLAAGFVPIEVLHYESVGAAELQLSYAPPGSERQVVPQTALIPDSTFLRGTTDILGTFSIPRIPTHLRSLRVGVAAKIGQSEFSGFSEPIVILGGITDAGSIVVH